MPLTPVFLRGYGHWCGELQGDSILESEYLLMKFILGQENQPMADGADGLITLQRIASSLRKLQRSDGGWGQFPGSGVDLSATVKAYYALKLAGDSPDAPHMARARQAILAHGGAARANVFTRTTLALFGQVPWRAVPVMPVEIMLLPRWSYFNLLEVSYWSRTVIVPLLVLMALGVARVLEIGLEEDWAGAFMLILIPAVAFLMVGNELRLRGPVLVITEEGLLDRRRGETPVPWERIQEASIKRRLFGKGIRIVLTDGERYDVELNLLHADVAEVMTLITETARRAVGPS